MPSEAVMRIGSVLLLIWLVIGAIAGGQRHYYSGSDPNCAQTGTIIVTVLAGPLNYSGVNPKVSCKHRSRASALRYPPLGTAA
jgi:hypothetical protein